MEKMHKFCLEIWKKTISCFSINYVEEMGLNFTYQDFRVSISAGNCRERYRTIVLNCVWKQNYYFSFRLHFHVWWTWGCLWVEAALTSLHTSWAVSSRSVICLQLEIDQGGIIYNREIGMSWQSSFLFLLSTSFFYTKGYWRKTATIILRQYLKIPFSELLSKMQNLFVICFFLHVSSICLGSSPNWSVFPLSNFSHSTFFVMYVYPESWSRESSSILCLVSVKVSEATSLLGPLLLNMQENKFLSCDLLGHGIQFKLCTY